MVIDQRVIGLALVSLILSALVVFTLARETPDRPLEILKNQYPTVLPAGETAFSFAVVVREKLPGLKILFSVVTPAYPAQGDLIDPQKQYRSQDTPQDVLANLARLGWFRNRTSSLGIEPNELSRPISVGKSQFRMLLQDYAASLGAVLGENATLNVPLIFGAMINETGYACHLEGEPGFFHLPEVNINVLTISCNEDEKKYVQDEKVWEGSGQLPLSQAPRGVVEFQSLARDDIITVIITAEPRTFAAPSYRKDVALIQVIRIVVDGQLYDEPIVNVVT